MSTIRTSRSRHALAAVLTLGLLPLGTANDFARTLETSGGVEASWTGYLEAWLVAASPEWLTSLTTRY